MNVLDIVFLIPIGWGIYKGFSKGLIQEVAQFAALLAGVFAGLYLSDFVAKVLIDLFNTGPETTRLIAFLIAFLLAMALVFAVARLVSRSVEAVHLGIINRIAGAVFGSAKYLLILSVLINFLNSSDKNGNLVDFKTRNGSLLYNPIGLVAPYVLPKMMKVLPSNPSDNKSIEDNDAIENE